MELLIKGDEIGYISREDDQSFGLFCPVVQIYDDAIAAQLVDAWNSKASPASAPEGWKHSCNALCLDGVELWIPQCPHCGKPAPTTPVSEDRNKLELYGELLYAVANKFPGESRHQTALRYIRNTEKGSDNAAMQEDNP